MEGRHCHGPAHLPACMHATSCAWLCFGNFSLAASACLCLSSPFSCAFTAEWYSATISYLLSVETATLLGNHRLREILSSPQARAPCLSNHHSPRRLLDKCSMVYSARAPSLCLTTSHTMGKTYTTGPPLPTASSRVGTRTGQTWDQPRQVPAVLNYTFSQQVHLRLQAGVQTWTVAGDRHEETTQDKQHHATFSFPYHHLL